ncbi:TetR/AcrR family transcriptional regulator [Cellulomonas fimi]|uniref:TetR/AcrR family transcriptional regulator n=1 Tax=Cellulomonas fimi TaxID=1708 RepID=A0A7Y0QHY9_CELFI|nr:TetR/AcrR family transcriptional regulator [Cellulomonas fimi]NMR21691.1 TetR/AcrR family transcriptional regulator [Cellulomonas fimi]
MTKGEETRLAVLDDAAALASRLGLGGLTIGTLATEARLSKSGLFAHFGSKESLQLQVIEHTEAQFVAAVLRPALAAPRGEPRVRALYERWVTWSSEALPGGCLFVAAGAEFDDRPGPVRDRLARQQQGWRDSIAQVFRAGVAEGHFAADADAEQFAHELVGIVLSYHQATRLLLDPKARTRADRAFENLLASRRPVT